MTKRLTKWFKKMEEESVTYNTIGHKLSKAKYVGKDSAGNEDPIGEGQRGKIYRVFYLDADKLDAPNPPFLT